MGKLVFLSIIGGGLAVLAIFLNFSSEPPPEIQNSIVPKKENKSKNLPKDPARVPTREVRVVPTKEGSCMCRSGGSDEPRVTPHTRTSKCNGDRRKRRNTAGRHRPPNAAPFSSARMPSPSSSGKLWVVCSTLTRCPMIWRTCD